MPRAWYSASLSATSSWLPTSAVPAPPRTRPTPDHRPGETSSSRAEAYDVRPSRSASILACPVDSLAASRAWAAATVSGSIPSSSHCACRQASSLVSRERVCTRSPKRRVRPCSRGQGAHPLELLRDQLRGLAPRQVDVGVLGRHRTGRPRGAPEVDVRAAARSRPRPGRPRPRRTARRSRTAAAPTRRGARCRNSSVRAYRVAFGLGVAEPGLLAGLAAGDDVEHQAAAGDPLVGRRHLRGEHRVDHAGPERDQELQPRRLRAGAPR